MTTKQTTTKRLISTFVILMGLPLGILAYNSDVHRQYTQPSATVIETYTSLLNKAKANTNKTATLSICKLTINTLTPRTEVHVVFNTYHKAGILLYNNGLFNVAKLFLTKATEYKNVITDQSKIAITAGYLGWIRFKKQQYNSAITHSKTTLKIYTFINEHRKPGNILNSLSAMCWYKRYSGSALEYLNKVLAIRSGSLIEKVLLGKLCNSLFDWNKQHKTYKEALKYKNLYITIKDKITDEQALQSSAHIKAVNKHLLKEEQISIPKQDNLDKSASLELTKCKRKFYLIISITLLIFVIILILSYRSKRKMERLLTVRNNELKQLNATKDKFFSIIAHDLKSPFSSLMGFAEMLALNAESNNTKEVIEYSQIIHNSTKRLLNLVENLLQWSRTQIGTTEYNPSKIDISIQTHNIVSLLRLTAEEKDVVLSLKVERNLMAWADNNLYNTILRNILNNAIKFSRVGSVIYITAGIKNNMIEVSVADSGVGIRQENLERLFMVDSTFSTNGTFNEKGTGLGLVLCKEFIEINKGQIWAKSELEKGSTFYFTLPLAATNEIEKS